MNFRLITLAFCLCLILPNQTFAAAVPTCHTITPRAGFEPIPHSPLFDRLLQERGLLPVENRSLSGRRAVDGIGDVYFDSLVDDTEPSTGVDPLINPFELVPEPLRGLIGKGAPANLFDKYGEGPNCWNSSLVWNDPSTPLEWTGEQPMLSALIDHYEPLRKGDRPKRGDVIVMWRFTRGEDGLWVFNMDASSKTRDVFGEIKHSVTYFAGYAFFEKGSKHEESRYGWQTFERAAVACNSNQVESSPDKLVGCKEPRCLVTFHRSKTNHEKGAVYVE